MQNIEKQTWSIPEVAQVLGISRVTAYNMVKEGTIPTIRLGKRLVVPKKALEKWMEEASKPLGGR